jgi:hypothetical protein
MNKKTQRMKQLFSSVIAKEGEETLNLTERAIWMSARELGAGQITMMSHSESGYGVSIDLSPSQVMKSFDQYGNGSFTVWLTDTPSMEIYGSPAGISNPLDWEDMLRAGKTVTEAPESIMISGKEYKRASSFDNKADADGEVNAFRSDGDFNAQIRRKAGMFVVYVRPKAAKKPKAVKAKKAKKAPAKKAKKAPAKKAAKKKTPAKKAKQPKAKKPSDSKGKA